MALPVIQIFTPSGDRRVDYVPGPSLRELLEMFGTPVRADCGGNGVCGQCRVQVESAESLPFSEGERRFLTLAEMRDGTRLSCQIHPSADLRVTSHSAVEYGSWRALRDDELSPQQPVFLSSQTETGLGLAIDLGTTHIRITLWALAEGRRLAGRAGLNPQIAYGSDVLSRLMAAGSSAQASRNLARAVVDAIAVAVAEMLLESGLPPGGGIDKVAIVGNTAMLALLANKNHRLLLDPDYWTQPIDCQPDEIEPFVEAWGLARDACLLMIPPLGGFVGSDLLADVLATGLMEGPPGSLLIDFGTNSEMALWDGQYLWITSTAGGPAFEGSGISCGMPGEEGAIFQASLSELGFDLAVLGNTAPRGICGSGLVDAIASLRRAGYLDRIGRLQKRFEQGYPLTSDAALTLNAKDIDVFQRAKAAIGAGVTWLCQQAGILPDDLARICVCGAFGRLLDIANAKAIGLLPLVDDERIELDGNTALAGCEALLLSRNALEKTRRVRTPTRLFNVAEDPVFEMMFVENLYLQSMQGKFTTCNHTGLE